MITRLNRRTRRKCRGFTLIEIMVSVTMVTFILLLVSASFPVAFRGQQASRNYAQAALIAQHKIDQMRQSGFSRLNLTSLSSLGIVDSTPNADGSFSFTNVDRLIDNGSNRGFFAANTTSSIVVSQALSGQGANAPSLIKAAQVSVTITWHGSGGNKGSFTTHTIIATH